MLHEKNLHTMIADSVGNYIRCARQDELACAVDIAGAPDEGFSDSRAADLECISPTMRAAARGFLSAMYSPIALSSPR